MTVAIVTGASRGIGPAIAARLAADGMRVACVARTLEPDPKYVGSLAETVDGIRASGGTAIAVRANLADAADRERIVQETEAQLGPVDVLVNNAAVTYLLPVREQTDKRMQLMFEVQVWAPMHLSRLVLPGMRERERGWILNISSRASVHPIGPPFMSGLADGGFTIYGMCKAALERMSTGLAAEEHRYRIAVNSLSPTGLVVTPGTEHHQLQSSQVEHVSVMAAAAHALVSGDPSVLTGRVALSQQLVSELGLTV